MFYILLATSSLRLWSKRLYIFYRPHTICRVNMQRLQKIVTNMRLRFTGRMLRMSDGRHIMRALRWAPLDGKLKSERPRVP